MIVIWSFFFFGAAGGSCSLTIAHRFEILSLVTYLTMGWLSLIVVYQLASEAGGGGTCWRLAGWCTR